MPFFPIDRGREMSLAVGVFYEKTFACFDDADCAVTSCDLPGRIEVNDILAARRGMPIQVVFANGTTKNYLAVASIFRPFDFNISKMGLPFSSIYRLWIYI